MSKLLSRVERSIFLEEYPAPVLNVRNVNVTNMQSINHHFSSSTIPVAINNDFTKKYMPSKATIKARILLKLA